MSTSDNNKRIAKNTMFLYFRMLFIMAISLYTSRVVLNTLGVEDYGIQNVVGGVITMFAFINSSMSSATQRYITFAIGKGEEDKLQEVFATSLQIHAMIALIIIILGETIGLWFLYEKLVIPESRMIAAIWVYQCSIASTVVGIMSVPFNADIVAHERMSVFAYISIVEVILKLAIVYALIVSPVDKLITYALLLLSVHIVITSIYIHYCNKHFLETRYRHLCNVRLLKEMSSFAGWSFWGNLAYILYTQGLNMMLNMFFGPIVNAARGIAVQVQGAVQHFVSNFQMALNPQITKSYAQDDLEQMHSLMFRSARFSFFLLYFLTLPLLLETNWVLTLWLKQVPNDTVIFTQIMIGVSLLYTIANPCMIANQATGEVKVYQAVVGGILLMILPVSYVVLKMGAPAYSVFIVHFVFEVISQCARMIILRDLIKLPVVKYMCKIYIPIGLVVFTSTIIPMVVHIHYNEGLMRFILVSSTCFSCTLLSLYTLGLTDTERKFINNKIYYFIKNSKKIFQ